MRSFVGHFLVSEFFNSHAILRQQSDPLERSPAPRRITIVISLRLPKSCTMLLWTWGFFSSVFSSESQLELLQYLLCSWSFRSACPDVR
jgi:hypothetical protein